MTRVTKAFIARESDKLFANSPAFNAGVEMAGRETALRTMTAIVRGETPNRIARLSDLLGAGKTFFLQSGQQELSKKAGLDEERESALVDYRELDRSGILENPKLRLLMVDELDRKAGRDDILRAVDSAVAWQRDDRVLILTGDYTLKHPDLEAVVGEPQLLDLEPLDAVLFVRTMRKRLGKALRQVDPRGDLEDEVNEAAERLVDPGLLSVLLPETDPPVATFREVLGIAQRLASMLPVSDEPCVIDADTFHALAASDAPRRRPADQVEFLENLGHEIRRRRAEGESWPQMELHEFPWLTDLDESQREAYEKRVIDPLIRAKLLLPMGIPYSGTAARRTPGPYLPTARAFLSAVFTPPA